MLTTIGTAAAAPGSAHDDPPPARAAGRYRLGGRRDSRLDLLRGLCLLKMVLDHMWRTPLHVYEHFVGFISAAEGFFFLSGTVAGIVYGKQMERDGFRPALGRIWKRALVLLLANFAALLLMLLAERAGLTGLDQFRRFWQGDPRLYKFFQFDQPYLLHLLPRYAAFLAVTPFALWLLLRGRTLLVLAASLALYVWNHAHQGAVHLFFFEPGYSYFPMLSWQLMFFVGLVCGVHRERLSRVWHRLGARRIASACALLVAGFIALQWALRAGIVPLDQEKARFLLDRHHLGGLRLVNCAALFGVAFFLVDRFWKEICTGAGWLLLPFGRHSLYVFLLHIPLVEIGRPQVDRLLQHYPMNPWILTLSHLLVVALLLVLVRRRVLFRWIRV